MWGREGGGEEKSSKHIYLHPLHLRGTVVYLHQEIGWKDFSFLEYRQILGRAWIEEIQKRRGRGERVSTCLGRQKSR